MNQPLPPDDRFSLSAVGFTDGQIRDLEETMRSGRPLQISKTSGFIARRIAVDPSTPAATDTATEA